ncbi:YdbH domain-containing protein [Pontixanthobacter aestiaquae]|uniref:Exoprotein n=1 Tax=Pontixanthobacter aestiaquae TaxID=1509367 RepID=A0A844Z7G9_9SPHN|nr:YdbH domain-containing protein [Pontixanthobacter aestiaquae]MDN3645145.1 YdbH domain-containing protein [Pontixanthobacter aestiaquae]MXO83855.1 exoprotein [Pontixanthobacter aestiaquae]
MASQADIDAEMEAPAPVLKKRRCIYRVVFGLLIILFALVIYGWTMREQLARDLIGEQLAGLDLPATYTIEDISTDRQVLTNIVVGDPDDPDLTIERAEIALAYGFGVPEIGRITLIRPRLYGSFVDNALSFGSLDTIIFAESDDPAGLPAWDVNLVDGRALIESDYGDIGLKAEGAGRLDGGFAGIVAAVAPEAQYGGCSAEQASLYGDIATSSGKISLEGPVRIASLRCPESGVVLQDFGYQASTQIDADFAGISVDGTLSTGLLDGAVVRMNRLSGPLSIAFKDDKLDSRFMITADALTSQQVAARSLEVDGSLRMRDDFSTAELQADVAGSAVTISDGATVQLTELETATEGTLLQPLIAKLSGALIREVRDTTLQASLIGRQEGDVRSLVIPQATLRGQGGSQLLSLSRLQYAQNGARTPRVSGNFRVGGRDLPPLVGRMEFTGSGQSVFRVRMDRYSAGDSSIALPEMLVTQNASGAITFAGNVTASGPLPGGAARSLSLPVDGSWSSVAGLQLWRQCTQIGFDSLAFANLALSSRSVTLCPAKGRAIVTQNASGLRIAAGAPSLDLSGTLAGTPIRLSSGPVGLAYPGVASAKALNIALGPEEEASRFIISDLVARLGEGVAGSFSGADIGLFAVPIDLQQSSGEWEYTDGVLTITNGQFTLVDRAPEPRYFPFVARGATLTLADNVIQANATLRAPESDRAISDIAIRHNLNDSTGFADLAVDGVLFDDTLQPEDLTELAKGVVANVKGLVTGSGRVDWNAQEVTSYGAFSSESLDLAALFGPVRGASGTVEFVDLLSLTTAPDQRIKVASVNPGIEAVDGEIGFSLRDGQFLGVTGGTWPFMGGTLTLRPVNLNLSAVERRRYVLAVEGLDSAIFVENMELSNLSAKGVFDGQLPIVFDELGFGQVEGGQLQSRAGGNVSYVGELTYEDLSPMANYAFNTLKSLDYTSMRIDIAGPLTGDIVTKLAIKGVRQGEGTKQNFITRQLADLPIQFNVNIKAPFYKLPEVMRAIYDPATIAIPAELGRISEDGKRFIPAARRAPAPEMPALPNSPTPDAIKPDESTIQTSDSEELP